MCFFGFFFAIFVYCFVFCLHPFLTTPIPNPARKGLLLKAKSAVSDGWRLKLDLVCALSDAMIDAANTTGPSERTEGEIAALNALKREARERAISEARDIQDIYGTEDGALYEVACLDVHESIDLDRKNI